VSQQINMICIFISRDYVVGRLRFRNDFTAFPVASGWPSARGRRICVVRSDGFYLLWNISTIIPPPNL